MEEGRPGVAVAAGRSGGGESEGGVDYSPPACLLDKAGPEDLVLDLSNTATWERGSQTSRVVGPGEKGLYVLLYCMCPAEGQGVAAGAGGGHEEGGHRVAFKLRVEFWNEGAEGAPDYLSAGSESLPELFLGTFALFFGALVVWAQCIRRHPAQASVFCFLCFVLCDFRSAFGSLRTRVIWDGMGTHGGVCVCERRGRWFAPQFPQEVQDRDGVCSIFVGVKL